MPTPTEIIDQQNKRISALTAENRELRETNTSLEASKLILSRDNDSLKKDVNDLYAMIARYKTLTEGLAKPMEGVK